ncbi:MAG: hypothetical protein KAU26_07960 [Methylococcales bacterium]|nr:hypothetical protein [Methylococcales bacterium]
MTDNELKELVASLAISQKETDKQRKETGKQLIETDRKLDKVAKMLGGIGANQGDFIRTINYTAQWLHFILIKKSRMNY